MCLAPILEARIMSTFTEYLPMYDMLLEVNRDRAVGLGTSYGLDYGGVRVRVPAWARYLSSPLRPHRLWGRPRPLG
jgi:hypothetical protein